MVVLLLALKFGGGCLCLCIWLVGFFSHAFSWFQVNLSSVFKLKALKGDLSVTATCGRLTHIEQKSFSLRVNGETSFFCL